MAVKIKDICTEFPMLPPVDYFYKKIRSYLDAVKDGGKVPIPSEKIIINQAIVDGINKSNKLVREIEIEISEI